MSDVAQLVKWVRKVSMRLESGAPGITERSAMSVTARLSADALTEQAAEIDRLREALEFYADPETYTAIMVMADSPCGEFASDISDVEHDFYENSYGATARAALGESK